MKHPHAELMLEYAKDAMETDMPWELWEYKYKNDEKWSKLFENPKWDISNSYQREQKTININGFEVPEPCKVKPNKNNTYYIVNINAATNHYYDENDWTDDSYDNRFFDRGLIHLSKENAIAHAKALLSFTVRN